MTASVLRHDEQEDEAYFDDRDGPAFEDGDPGQSGRLNFPLDKLYGRDTELGRLGAIYDGLVNCDRGSRTRTTRRTQIESLTSDGGSCCVFLSGYSGTGKSALVKEFIRRLENDHENSQEASMATRGSSRRQRQVRPRFLMGKYDELHHTDPYSAIADAFNAFGASLLGMKQRGPKQPQQQQKEAEELELEQVRKHLQTTVGDDNIQLLSDIMPVLCNALRLNTDPKSHSDNTNEATDERPPAKELLSTCIRRRRSVAVSSAQQNRIKNVFRIFVEALSTEERPLILFLDDLQWIDDASLKLLECLLSSPTLEHCMFIGAYRSNEVDETHGLHHIMIEISEEEERRVESGVGSGTTIENMDLPDLSIHDVGQFIADTLRLTADEVQPLTEEVYHKTLGNIFYTMQGLEELVRRNGLYYDVMFFRWEWNMQKIQDENLLGRSGDVVDMVRNKIQTLSTRAPLLQQALTVASLTKSTVSLVVLDEILAEMQESGDTCKIRASDECDKDSGGASSQVSSPLMTPYSRGELTKLLDQAVLEGLLLNPVGSQDYTFAHDRIQEAASSFISGDDKDRLCYLIATVLLRHVEQNLDTIYEEWMMFTAVHYLNSVPFSYVEASKETSADAGVYLATWNIRGAKLAIDKSAFPQAVEFLRKAESCLNSPEKWKLNYSLCITLYQRKLETEFSLGNHAMAQQAVDEVLTNAKTLPEKCLAQYYDVELITCQKDRNYTLGVARGVEYLSQHGVALSTSKHLLEGRLLKEKLRLQMVQGKRKLTDLLDESMTPVMDSYNQAIMRLLMQLSTCLLFANQTMAAIVDLIATRLSFERGINQYLPSMLSHYAMFLRQQGKFEEAYKYGAASYEMLNKISEGPSWVRGVNGCSGCILPLRTPIDQSIEPLHQAHKVALACGDVEWAGTSAMQYALCYFCAGWPINALFEPKLILFEEEAHQFGQPPSIIVTFGIFRQCVLNLQGKGHSNPVLLSGVAVDENDALKQFEGSTYKQTLRDISIFRLFLAVVFGDDAVSVEMVDRLAPYADFDYPLARQHLRDVLVGIASLSAARRLNDKKYARLGRQKLQQFQRLAKAGSRNAPAMALCLKAECKPSLDRYSSAITACSEAGFVHLEAIMNERCAQFLSSSATSNHNRKNVMNNGLADEEQEKLAEAHFSNALWLYSDWGATGKVNQMKKQHSFLKNVRRAGRNSGVFLKLRTSLLSSDENSSRASFSYTGRSSFTHSVGTSC